jgi:hypothetical protein
MFEIFALSTTGLRAGDGNRTRMASLEGWVLQSIRTVEIPCQNQFLPENLPH